MTAIDFLSLADRRLAYQRQVGNKNSPGILFLSGFASDMSGTKASFLAQKAAECSIPFLRFDYRGCGLSSEAFTDGNLSAWLEDTLAVFDRLTEGPQIVVGSSMGGWLGLLLLKARAERIRAFIGIAAAPDFTEELIWNKLSTEKQKALLRDGVFYEDTAPADRRVPITLNLIEDARKHLFFGNAPITVPCPVRLLQGMKDKDVPWAYAPRIAEHLKQEDIEIHLVKKGDHSLSTAENLDALWKTITLFTQQDDASR